MMNKSELASKIAKELGWLEAPIGFQGKDGHSIAVEEFTDREKAKEHFGYSHYKQPACHIDITEYRRMESEVESWRNEGHEIQIWHESKLSEHRAEVRHAEEKGYDKAVQDMTKLAENCGYDVEAMLQSNEQEVALQAPGAVDDDSSQGE